MAREMTTEESKARNEMLRELCEALGWGNFASPQTPEAVWFAALGGVREMRQQNESLRAQIEHTASSLADTAHRYAPVRWSESR